MASSGFWPRIRRQRGKKRGLTRRRGNPKPRSQQEKAAARARAAQRDRDAR